MEEKLFEEIIYENLYKIGIEDETESEKNAQFQYIQDAFNMTNQKHEQALIKAINKPPPNLHLKIECIEAQELLVKLNVAEEPYVTMFLASDPNQQRFSTSGATDIRNPVWNQDFCISLCEHPEKDNLVIEVMAKYGADRIIQKLQSKTTKSEKLIGRVFVPLKSIPANGVCTWYSLDKKGKQECQGLIKLKLKFYSKKNFITAMEEHLHLLNVLLSHELNKAKVAEYWWSGKFNSYAEAILSQHITQSELNEIDIVLAQWSTFTNKHQEYPLSFDLFEKLLDFIIKEFSDDISDYQLRIFWLGVKKFLPPCFIIVRDMRLNLPSEDIEGHRLHKVLRILGKIGALKKIDGIDFFPECVYSWINLNHENLTITKIIEDLIVIETEKWFDNFIKEDSLNDTTSEYYELENCSKLIDLFRTDLLRGIEFYDDMFQSTTNVGYSELLFHFYEKKSEDLIRPVIEKFSSETLRIDFPEDLIVLPVEDIYEIEKGTLLFRIYLKMKRFMELGAEIINVESVRLQSSHFYEWFKGCVPFWLDIALFKLVERTKTTVDLDNFESSNDKLKCSSSAIDMLDKLHKHILFWKDLAWPEVDEALMFFLKIVNDLSRCVVYYAKEMSNRIEEIYTKQHKYFTVTREWCLVINNIDFIRQSLSESFNNLQIDKIKQLSETHNITVVEKCIVTLQHMIEKAIDIERFEILGSIEVVAARITQSIEKHLISAGDTLQDDVKAMNKIFSYLDQSFDMFRNEWNYINFQRMLNAVWYGIIKLLKAFIENNLNKVRPPSFFSNLKDNFQKIVENFKDSQNEEEQVSDTEIINTIYHLLELHGYETPEVIHKYHLARLNEQNCLSEPNFGELTIQAKLVDDILKIDVLYASYLVPLNSRTTCHPYIRIRLLPSEKFIGIEDRKTAVQTDTLFPLYGEHFKIKLSPEQRSLENGLIFFSIKEKVLFGFSNQLLGECYIAMKDIETGKAEKQTHLKLLRTRDMSIEWIRILEKRPSCKQAKDFLHKIKEKKVKLVNLQYI